jgi:hypothetical protein
MAHQDHEGAVPHLYCQYFSGSDTMCKLTVIPLIPETVIMSLAPCPGHGNCMNLPWHHASLITAQVFAVTSSMGGRQTPFLLMSTLPHSNHAPQ